MGRTKDAAVQRYVPIAPHIAKQRPDKVAEIVARDLVNGIIAAGLQPGDSLDSEPAMIERFGVSRESLREGLRLLEVQGLITIKRGPGGGAFVGTVDPANLGRMASLYFNMAGATYEELFEAYVFADAALAARAARNPDEAWRRAVMSQYLSHGSFDGDVDTYVRKHAGFHTALAVLADNRVLEIALGAIGMLVGRHYVALADVRRSRPFVADDHADIAAAIIAGDRSESHRLAVVHLERVVAMMRTDGLDPDAVIGLV